MRVVIYLTEYNMSTILLEFGKPGLYHGSEMYFLKNPIRYAFEVNFIIIFYYYYFVFRNQLKYKIRVLV